MRHCLKNSGVYLCILLAALKEETSWDKGKSINPECQYILVQKEIYVINS